MYRHSRQCSINEKGNSDYSEVVVVTSSSSVPFEKQKRQMTQLKDLSLMTNFENSPKLYVIHGVTLFHPPHKTLILPKLQNNHKEQRIKKEELLISHCLMNII